MTSDLIPALSYKAVTTSDTVDIVSGQVARALYVGSGGNIVAVGSDGNAITFTAVPTGMILPIFVKRVNATNTTASSLVALF